MAKDAYYFSHDSNSRNDAKCLKLRRVLGMEGYGIFWVLIEMLRESDGYKLPLSVVPDVAFEARVSEEKVKSVIANFDLFQIDEELFFSPRLLRSMDVLETRKKLLSDAGRRGVEARLKGGLNEVQALKESKVKESKVNNTVTDFELFWNSYGKKVSKPKCEKAWSKLDQSTRELVLSKLGNYIKSTPDVTYRKNPLTYLNNRSWEDDIIFKTAFKINANPYKIQ